MRIDEVDVETFVKQALHGGHVSPPSRAHKTVAAFRASGALELLGGLDGGLTLGLALGELGIACRRWQPYLCAGGGGLALGLLGRLALTLGLLLCVHSRLADARDSTSPFVCVCVCVCKYIYTYSETYLFTYSLTRTCTQTHTHAHLLCRLALPLLLLGRLALPLCTLLAVSTAIL